MVTRPALDWWTNSRVDTPAGWKSNDRIRALRLLESAARVYPRIAAFSPLGTVLVSRHVARMVRPAAAPRWGVAAGTVTVGYALRLAEPSRPPAVLTASPAVKIAIDAGGELDYEALDGRHERVTALLELTCELAADTTLIASLSSVSTEAWRAFSDAAIYRLSRNLGAEGVPRDDFPGWETLEDLVRFGYALRILEEAVGERPALRPDPALSHEPPAWSQDSVGGR